MAAKHYTSIDFIIDGCVFYSSKALIESPAKPLKSTIVVSILITSQSFKKKRKIPEPNPQLSTAPQIESSPDKSEEEYEVNDMASSNNDPLYEESPEDEDFEAEANVRRSF